MFPHLFLFASPSLAYPPRACVRFIQQQDGRKSDQKSDSLKKGRDPKIASAASPFDTAGGREARD